MDLDCCKISLSLIFRTLCPNLISPDEIFFPVLKCNLPSNLSLKFVICIIFRHLLLIFLVKEDLILSRNSVWIFKSYLKF